jgi:heptaprenyl diphosphate synthase
MINVSTDVPASSTAKTESTAHWMRCPRVLAKLQEVESRLLEQCVDEDPYVSTMVRHLIQSGGKRLRPTLVLLSAEFGDENCPAAVDLAIAVELLHVATLYHDDVIDQADVRRGRPSANLLWGNRPAAFAGSYLFARAARLFAEAGVAVNQMVSHCVAEVWKGETLEMERIFDLDADEQSYFRIVDKKTAALCELPCRLGAFAARVDPAWSEGLTMYGRKLGIAFQITDDILDLVGDEAITGKAAGIDLLDGVYTLPVLYAIKGQSSAERLLRSKLSRGLSAGWEQVEAVQLVRSGAAISRALKVAESFAQEAVTHLAALPIGAAKQSLMALAGEVTERIPRHSVGPA